MPTSIVCTKEISLSNHKPMRKPWFHKYAITIPQTKKPYFTKVKLIDYCQRKTKHSLSFQDVKQSSSIQTTSFTSNLFIHSKIYKVPLQEIYSEAPQPKLLIKPTLLN